MALGTKYDCAALTLFFMFDVRDLLCYMFSMLVRNPLFIASVV